MDDETIVNPSPKPMIPVGSRGDPKALGTHLYERIKDGPMGALVDLVAIGPIAVNHAVQAVIHANSKLVQRGTFIMIVPTKRVVERRPSKDSGGPEYTDSHATVLVVSLRVCE